jgi:hypothetical protein
MKMAVTKPMPGMVRSRRAGLNESLELVLDEGDLLGAVPEHVSDRRLADTGWVLETGLIRCAHRNQLGTTNDKPLQLSLVLITQVGRRRVEGEPVEGGHTGVDLVGLRKTTRGSSGIADAPGIGDVDFEAGVLDRPVGGALVSSCSLHEDQLFVYFTEPADQGGKALGAVPDDELVFARRETDFELLRGDIDSSYGLGRHFDFLGGRL